MKMHQYQENHNAEELEVRYKCIVCLLVCCCDLGLELLELISINNKRTRCMQSDKVVIYDDDKTLVKDI